MSIVKPRTLVFALIFICMVSCLELGDAAKYPSICLNAQTDQKVRSLKSDFIPEDGCPITVSGIRTELDMDPFDVPIDSRIYIDYQNVSQQQVLATKFRLRFTDDTGKDLGTFNGSHGAMVGPGQSSSEKWKREKIDPRTTSLKCRVLMVKLADGTLWQSVKAQASPQPAQQQEPQEDQSQSQQPPQQ